MCDCCVQCFNSGGNRLRFFKRIFNKNKFAYEVTVKTYNMTHLKLSGAVREVKNNTFCLRNVS